MRIVYVIGTSSGGVGTHVRALARELGATGHEIGVVGPAATDAHFGFSALPGVRFASLEMGTGIGPKDAILVRRLTTLVRSFDAEIVHAHGFRAGLITHLGLRRLSPRPLFILSLHNQASGQGLRGRVETRIETLLARGADLTLGASQDLVDRARELGARDARFLPAAAPEVTTIDAEAAQATRAALASEYGFDEGAVIVLAVGRVAPQKNYPMLVRALGHLGQDRLGAGNDANPGPGTRRTDAGRDRTDPGTDRTDAAPSPLVVLIAGAADDAVLAEVRTQYAELTTTSASVPLHFLGPRSDIAELNAAADVSVLTSVWEARALVLQEALISGQAIVATATGGTPGLIGDAGILVPADDDRALALALGELAADPARRAELGARARTRGVALPTERDVAEELLGIYTELTTPQVG
ncbi:glycosyltransferase family 4 protein [Brevibacterium sp. GP-SGM9]|uniref:glycosyltransferase family 4 protein n=1 Tax=Brevibacterium sp. GP-SGM9 TaxID=3376990 RepID=UPI0039A55E49